MNPDATDQPLWLSRRGAVKTAAGVATAGAVLAAGSRTPAEAATAPRAAAAAAEPATSAATAAAVGTGAAQSFVVHVRDVRTGELAFFVGEQEITVHDHALAAQLVAAVR